MFNCSNNMNRELIIQENKNIEIEDEKNFHKLPPDTLLKIFEYLRLDDLEKIRFVNKKWNKQASGPVLLRNKIINEINEIAFGNKNWIKAFGSGFIPEKEMNKDIEFLPKDIEKILLNKCQIDPKANKMVYKTHVFVWIPKTVMIDGEEVNLTIRTMGQLMKKMFFSNNKDGYKFIWPNVMKQYGDQPMDKSGWVLLSRDLILGSRDKSYSEQQELIKNLADTTKPRYEVPQALLFIVSIFAEYMKSGQITQLLNNSVLICGRCQESVDGYQVIVGGFIPDGLCVFYFKNNRDSFGVVALRNF